MKLKILILIGLTAVLTVTGCASATPPPPPTADVVSTVVFQTVFAPLTLTASAPTITPSPTITPTPTKTPKPPPVKDTTVTADASCWSGPGENRKLISNISETKIVEILGVGSVPDWYIIRNPYFYSPCWIEAKRLIIDPSLDMSIYPVMTPGP